MRGASGGFEDSIQSVLKSNPPGTFRLGPFPPGKVNLSYDFKPAVNLSGGNSVLYTQTAVSVRYVIAKRHDIWDKAKERDRRKARKQRQRDKRKAQRQADREARGKQWFQFWKKAN